MIFERGADLRPRPVQQHPLVRLGEIERVTHLVGPPSFEIAERDHHLLTRRHADRWPAARPRGVSPAARRVSGSSSHGTGGDAHAPRPACPRVGTGPDRPRPPAVSASDTSDENGTDRCSRRALRAGDVHHDPVDPRLQRRSLLEPVDAGDHREPGSRSRLRRPRRLTTRTRARAVATRPSTGRAATRRRPRRAHGARRPGRRRRSSRESAIELRGHRCDEPLRGVAAGDRWKVGGEEAVGDDRR